MIASLSWILVIFTSARFSNRIFLPHTAFRVRQLKYSGRNILQMSGKFSIPIISPNCKSFPARLATAKYFPDSSSVDKSTKREQTQEKFVMSEMSNIRKFVTFCQRQIMFHYHISRRHFVVRSKRSSLHN